MTATEMMEGYLKSYKVKRQEYLLEKSLQRLNIEKSQDEIAEAVGQLSMGPFIFEPQYNSFRICIDGSYSHAYVGLQCNEKLVSKEVFLEKITEALESCVRQDLPEKKEVNGSYASLILQLIKNSDIYDRVINAYEHYNTAIRALHRLCKDFQAWNTEVWDKLYDVAIDWCTNKESIKPGTEVEVVNLKNYTSRIKQVQKLVEKDGTTKIVFKDNTRLNFPSSRISTVGTWVLSHPEYKPLLDYLRLMEDEINLDV